jgi:hypothetical protein
MIKVIITKDIALRKLKDVKFQIGSKKCTLNIQSKKDCKVPGIIATINAQNA